LCLYPHGCTMLLRGEKITQTKGDMKMRKGNLTREQAIEIAGLETVLKVESLNCEPTSRLQTDGDESTEWSASVRFDTDEDAYTKTLVAYYYTTPEQNKILEEYDGDGSYIDWEINGYEIF
jgi:hypothetical protein